MAKTEAFYRSTRRYKGATKMHPLLFTCPTIKRALNTFLSFQRMGKRDFTLYKYNITLILTVLANL